MKPPGSPVPPVKPERRRPEPPTLAPDPVERDAERGGRPSLSPRRGAVAPSSQSIHGAAPSQAISGVQDELQAALLKRLRIASSDKDR